MLAEWLRQALDHKGLSQAELARQLTAALGRSIDRAAVNKMLVIGAKGRKIAADEMIVIERITGVPAPLELPRNVVLIGGQIGAGGAIDVSAAQDEEGITFEAELRASMSPDAVVAYEVVGDSMLPRYLPGTLLVCGNYVSEPDGVLALLGEELAVGTPDGSRYLKILERGTVEGRFHLVSSNAAKMRNVELAWVAEIVAIIPRKQWTRHQRAAQRQGRAAA